jgi:hypothetical protein
MADKVVGQGSETAERRTVLAEQAELRHRTAPGVHRGNLDGGIEDRKQRRAGCVFPADRQTGTVDADFHVAKGEAHVPADVEPDPSNPQSGRRFGCVTAQLCVRDDALWRSGQRPADLAEAPVHVGEMPDRPPDVRRGRPAGVV